MKKQKWNDLVLILVAIGYVAVTIYVSSRPGINKMTVMALYLLFFPALTALWAFTRTK